jgi:hypothetical protein
MERVHLFFLSFGLFRLVISTPAIDQSARSSAELSLRRYTISSVRLAVLVSRTVVNFYFRIQHNGRIDREYKRAHIVHFSARKKLVFAASVLHQVNIQITIYIDY